MKTSQSVSARRLAFATALAVFFVCSTLFLQVQASPGIDARKAGQKVEGCWSIFLSPRVPPGVPQPGPFKANGAFSRGGSFVGSSRDNDFSASQNPQYGAWEHRGGNRYAFAFEQNLLDDNGKFSGVLIADSQITLVDDDSFSGVTNAELRDADGNLILSLGCAAITGERMSIGTLSTSCAAP